MAQRNVVVVGGSAGAIEALQQILPALPADLDASVFVVVHSAEGAARGGLATVLARHASLPCAFGVDGETLEPRRIYVAPYGRHLVVAGKRLRTIDGPRENGFRPAVDPLFRSAALHHGAAVVGVVLSGARDDGAAGLVAIKERGGRAIVQAPQDCPFPGMPQSAMMLVDPDDVAPAVEIAARIVARTKESVAAEATTEIPLEAGMSISGRDDADPSVRSWDAFVCPDCGGVLRETDAVAMQRFQCRTGHAYSIESLLASQANGVEAALWSAVNVLREREDMSRKLAHRSNERGLRFATERYLREANTSAENAGRIVDVLKRITPLPSERAIAEAEEE